MTSTDLTNQYTKEQIEEWASKRADDAGRLSRQLLATMQREAKLLAGVRKVFTYNLDDYEEDEDVIAVVKELREILKLYPCEYPNV